MNLRATFFLPLLLLAFSGLHAELHAQTPLPSAMKGAALDSARQAADSLRSPAERPDLPSVDSLSSRLPDAGALPELETPAAAAQERASEIAGSAGSRLANGGDSLRTAASGRAAEALEEAEGGLQSAVASKRDSLQAAAADRVPDVPSKYSDPDQAAEAASGKARRALRRRQRQAERAAREAVSLSERVGRLLSEASLDGAGFLSLGETPSLNLSPSLEREVFPRFSLGLGLTYQGLVLPDERRASHSYGGRLLASYRLFKKAGFLRLEHEQVNAEGMGLLRETGPGARQWYGSWLVGGGYTVRRKGAGALKVTVLRNANWAGATPVHARPWVVRLSYTFKPFESAEEAQRKAKEHFKLRKAPRLEEFLGGK